MDCAYLLTMLQIEFKQPQIVNKVIYYNRRDKDQHLAKDYGFYVGNDPAPPSADKYTTNKMCKTIDGQAAPEEVLICDELVTGKYFIVQSSNSYKTIIVNDLTIYALDQKGTIQKRYKKVAGLQNKNTVIGMTDTNGLEYWNPKDDYFAETPVKFDDSVMDFFSFKGLENVQCKK